ncbi:MAG: TRAP transporter large permease [Fidelibacterota bacterium]|nr:MAG: TRAP transporter large permease [Candidatus Neomarinimicrobiota bacterium]
MLIGLFVALLLLIFLGTPVLLAIGVVALLGILITPDLVLAMFPQKMFTMLDSFSLLAMPYFILAGELMARGGLSRKLVQFGETVVGHLRGGLGHASIFSCMIFANVSGSASAATSAIGSILLPSMKERGYKPGFSASLLATSGIIGSIIPPSMVMIVYGAMAGVSIGGLFLAGILPGLLIVAVLMVVVYGHSFLPDFPELRRTVGRFNLAVIIKSIPKVWVALLAPVIILGGILGGIFTATEAGVVACIYSFLVSFFIYRSMRLRDLPRILARAAITTTMVVGIISVAGAFGWLLAYLDFNEIMLQFILGISNQPMVVLLILVASMMVMTMFVESLAILIIMVPVIIYISNAFGFDPYHFGMVMVMATQIGATTPPVAVGLFVATSIAGTSYDQTLRYCLPFVLALIVVMILVIFFPWLSNWIPHYYLG